MPRVNLPARTSLDDVKKALPLAKAVVKKLDADKDKEVSTDEIRRIRVRDNFVARDLFQKAVGNASYPDAPATIGRVTQELDQAFRSLQRADKNGDGVVTRAEMQQVSRVGQALVRFAMAHADHKVADLDIKPYEKPGTRAWVELARSEYHNKDSPAPRPYFGTALIIPRGELPTALRGPFDAFKRDNPGVTVQACSWLVNGEAAYYFHAMHDDHFNVQVLNKKGDVLGNGVARPKADPHAYWTVSWTD